ncbi:MAG: heavy metal translocating P-type ATPase metal-binding domain-containing protein [Sandaracinaceae bacterium]|nr:heavy metal translocating P-type ATPase metal-binding domain-containing protein [Sandaracinaceae bacterium]
MFDASPREPTPQERSALCAHCGQPLGNSSDAYCCHGCRAVASLLKSASLDRYYALRHGAGMRPTLVDEARRDRLWLGPIRQDLEKAEGVCRFALDVQGMHCAGCVWVMEELFRREGGGESILVNPALGRCEIAARKGFDVTRFVENVERLGYLMGPPGKQAEGIHDGLVVRAGVTVALAMNAMMFGIAQYFGLSEEPLRTTIATLEVVLAVAAVAVGGPTFFRAAWEGLRRGVLHLDLPIAVGLALSLVGTLVAFFRTGDASFADTLAVFVSLMLVGRMIERGALERNRHRLLASEGTDGLFARVRTRREEGWAETTSVVRASTLEPGARLVVAAGEVVPVDAVALSSATVSLDWLTGESKPLEVAEGEAIRAGAINAARRPLECAATSTLAASGLSELLRRESSDVGDVRARGLFHKVSAIWVVAVLVAAVGTFVAYWLAGDPQAGLSNATALLVVTCPCAIGIATPLAYQLAVGDLRRAGVIVRRTRTLDRLPEVDTIAFDKTGTLTTGKLRLSEASTGALEGLAAEELAMLAGVVAQSGHPKSVALLQAATAAGARDVPSLEVEERAGAGLRTQWNGHEVRVGRPAWALEAAPEALTELGADCDLVLSVDGACRAALSTEEEIRHDARAELQGLAQRGFRLAILSGDRVERVRRVARDLGLESLGVAMVDVLGDLTPEDKAVWLRAHGARALFVGDGINDSLAADTAFVSATPSLERPFLPAKTDFVFTDSGIAPVRWALVAAQRVRRASRRNVAFAVLYNLLGSSLAALGVFHPWVAAVLMPASSLFVVGRTLLAFRRGVDAASSSPAPVVPPGRRVSLVAALAARSLP